MASNKVGGPSEQLETVRKPVNRGRIETGKQIQRHKYTNTQICKYAKTKIRSAQAGEPWTAEKNWEANCDEIL